MYEAHRRTLNTTKGISLPKLTLPVMTLDGPTFRVYACWLDVTGDLSVDVTRTGGKIEMKTSVVQELDMRRKRDALKAQKVHQRW